MAWVKLDDHIDEHDKVLALGDAVADCMWLMIRALALCNRKETDGFLASSALARIGSDFSPAKRKRLVTKLVEVGMLHATGHDCDRCPDPGDGWQVHDYGEYQPTKARKDAERAEARERMRRARAAKRSPAPPEPAPEQDGSSGGVRTELKVNEQRSSDNPVPGPVPDVPDGTSLAPDKPARKPRPPDHIFDALVSACGLSAGELTQSARGRLNKAAKELRDVGASPEGIAARARVHRQRWPDAELTPTSLAANYAQLGASRNGSRSPPPADACQQCAQPLASHDDDLHRILVRHS